MGYVVSAQASGFNSTAATDLEIILPAGVEENDVLVVYLFSTAAKTWTEKTTSNWGSSVVNEDRTAIFTRVAGASESNPTFTITTGTAELTAICVLTRDIDTTGARVVDSASKAVNFSSTTVDTLDCTGEDDTLLLYFSSAYSSSSNVIFDPRLVTALSHNNTNIGNLTFAWTIQQNATAATTAWNLYSTRSTVNSQVFGIALKNAASGAMPGAVNPLASTEAAELIHPFTLSTAHGATGADTSALTVNEAGELQNCTYDVVTVKSVPVFRDQVKTPTYYTHDINGTEAASSPLCAGINLDSSEDFSDAILTFTQFAGDNDVDSLSSGGRFLGFVNGDLTDGYVNAWKVAASNSTIRPDKGVFPYVIDTTITPDETHSGGTGTTDLSTVTYIFTGITATTATLWYFGYLYKLNTMEMVGGISTRPASFTDCAIYSSGNTVLSCQSQFGQAASQFFVTQSIQVGSGGTTYPVYWDSANQSVEYAPAYDPASVDQSLKIDTARLTFSVYAGADDTINIANTTFNMGDLHNWGFNASSSTSATYSMAGAVVLNATLGPFPDLGAGREYDGISYSGCTEVTFTSGATFTNSTFDACAENQYFTVTSETEYQELCDSNTFTNNTGASAILITGNQTGTWSGNTVVVSGNTVDIIYTGTTDFTIENPTTLTETSASATLTISVPTVSLTVTSNIAASDLKIFDENTQTIHTSATDTTLSTTTAATYDITVQKAGYIPQRRTGVTLGAANVTEAFTLLEADVYNASHGLTFTTDYSYAPATRIMTIVANQEARDIYSAMIDDFISETSLRNVPFPLVAVGPDRIDFKAVGKYDSDTTVGATIDSGDITFWKGAGMEWEHDTTGNPTKKFYSIKSANTLQAGSVVGYTQVVTGTPVETTLVSDKVNEVIQYFLDTNGDGSADNDYTGHLLFKAFKTGYYQGRWDVINDGGAASLESYEYTINLLQDAIANSSGDQAVTIATLTDHTSSPLVVGSKNFDYELVDPGSNTAEVLLAQYNYDVFTAVDAAIAGTLYTSYQAFDLPDLVIEAGSTWETEYGYFEGDGAVTDLSGVYLSRSSADHPSITRFQSNDGTYYTPAVTANISITGMPTAGGSIRLQLTNETAKTASAWATGTAYSLGDKVLRSTGLGTESTAGLYFVCTTAGTSHATTEPTWDTTVGNTTSDNTVTWTTYAILYYDQDPAAASIAPSYTNLEEFSAGDTYGIRFAELNSSTSFKTYDTTGLVASTGFSVVVSVTADSVYATNALDGSDVSITGKFSPDYSNNEIDLDTNSDYAGTEAFAYYCYELTTSAGMYTVWGGFTAIDPANYRNNTAIFSIYFDETAGFVKQTDSSRIFRDDGTRPARDPTTGGNGIEINWRNPVYGFDAGGGGFTSGDRATLDAAATASALAVVDTNVDQIETAVITNAAGTDIAADIAAVKAETALIVADTNELQTDNVPGLIAALNDVAATDIVSGGAINTTAGAVDNVTLVATTTTNTDMRGTDSANTTAPDNAGITAIKAKTDDLTFTKANEVDVNIQSVNDVTVTGTGTDEDPWGQD